MSLHTAVERTQEFVRIERLPRREIDLDFAARVAAVLTEEFAVCSDAALRPMQGLALWEYAENGGGFFVLPLGEGKTLVTYLLPRVRNKTRPLLIVPRPVLQDKTYADFGSYVGTWADPPDPVHVETVSQLTTKRSLLDVLKPNLLMIDEADELANRRSAASKRITRYLLENPDTEVVILTATPGRRSIMNYWHLLCWTLGDRAPIPQRENEALWWAAALDERDPRQGRRPHPGPLGDTLENARRWYRDRLVQTPGVIVIDGDTTTAPLEIRWRFAPEDPVLNQHFETLLLTGDSPGGEPITDAFSRWRIDAQLGCGLYTEWRPRPPEDWMAARRRFARLVRTVLESDHSLDTEGEVARAYAGHPAVAEWKAIKPTFKPKTVAHWVTTSTLSAVLEWMAESDEPSIVWCGGYDFAERLSQISHLPYYGRRGRTRDGRSLLNAQGNIVVSWVANFKGLNLQRYRRHLIVHPPQSAKTLDQTIGRSHRQGQDRPVVVEILITSGGTIDMFAAACSEAAFVSDTILTRQKILRAPIVRGRPKITEANQFRWASATLGDQPP